MNSHLAEIRPCLCNYYMVFANRLSRSSLLDRQTFGGQFKLGEKIESHTIHYYSSQFQIDHSSSRERQYLFLYTEAT